MANDEDFRKKYESIIAMSQTRLAAAKASFASSGANVKNFGMSVGSNGATEFFATVEKNSTEQTEKLAKKQAEKKAVKAKEKKQAEKKAREDRIEKRREEYVTFTANNVDDLVKQVSDYAYHNRMNEVRTEDEKMLGQSIDFSS